MTNKEVEILDEALANDKDLQKELKKENNNKKNIKVIILAIIAALGVAASTLIFSFIGNRNKNKDENNSTSSSSSFSLDEMGNELEIPSTTTKKYGNVVSGSVDLDKVVEQNGKLYKDATEASKAKNTTTTIDLKNGTLKTSNGKVYDRTTGYEIKDETGKTVATGNLDNTGTPNGFENNENLGGTFEKEDNTQDLVRADADYYNEEGKLVIVKGSVVSKETLEYAKQHLTTTTTTKATTTTTTVKNNTTTKATTTTTTAADQGKVNKDGTYTIFGLTFKTKADYQQWVIQGYEGYVEADGIMISEEELNNRLQKTK